MDARIKALFDRSAELRRRCYVARMQAQNLAAWAFVMSRDGASRREARAAKGPAKKL